MWFQNMKNNFSNSDHWIIKWNFNVDGIVLDVHLGNFFTLRMISINLKHEFPPPSNMFMIFLSLQPLPQAFTRHLQKEKSTNKATLVNPNGKSWCIDVLKEKQDMHFEGQAWLNFLNINKLKLGYFLVFSYKGNMVFNFQAYGLSTCEIDYPSFGSKRKRTSEPQKQPKDQNSSTFCDMITWFN